MAKECYLTQVKHESTITSLGVLVHEGDQFPSRLGEELYYKMAMDQITDTRSSNTEHS